MSVCTLKKIQQNGHLRFAIQMADLDAERKRRSQRAKMTRYFRKICLICRTPVKNLESVFKSQAVGHPILFSSSASSAGPPDE